MADPPHSPHSPDDSPDPIPDAARSFFYALSRHLLTHNLYSLHQLYENDFPRISERYFIESEWPSPERFHSLVQEEEKSGERRPEENSPFALLLYRDLYFRHLHAKMQPTLDDRVDAFQCYVDIFNVILQMEPIENKTTRKEKNSSTLALELPLVWLYDILDEFISQFQSFHLFIHRTNGLNDDDKNYLRESSQVWSAATVLRYLHALVRKGAIDIFKPASSSTPDEETADGKVTGGATHPFFRTLGYYALVSLLRTHVILCDYQSALSVLTPIDLRRHRTLLTTIPACHVSLYYHLSVAYFMVRRYVDCQKICANFLIYRQRNKAALNKMAQQDLLSKRVEQIQGLLAMSYAISGEGVDDTIATEIREKFGERLNRLQKFEASVYEELFNSSTPKFIVLTPPDYTVNPRGDDSPKTPPPPTDNTTLTNPTDQKSLQWSIFAADIQQRQPLAPVHSYLKLFSSLSIPKLSLFLGVSEEESRALLYRLVNKSYEYRWQGGSPAEGKIHSLLESEVALDGEWLKVWKEKSVRKYGDFFVRQAEKCQEIEKEVEKLK